MDTCHLTFSQKNLTLSPNPTTTELNISAPANIKSIIITNLLGQTVYESVCNSAEANINVRHLPAGVYFVRVYGEGGVAHEVRRFVKE